MDDDDDDDEKEEDASLWAMGTGASSWEAGVRSRRSDEVVEGWEATGRRVRVGLLEMT
jgi:hypothetical protein